MAAVAEAESESESEPVNTEDVVGTVDNMDKCLAAYYKKVGVKYKINGIGKFKAYCEENGFDDESIGGELDVQDPTDCMLVEFDYDFDADKYTFPLERVLYYEHELLTFGYIRRYSLGNDIKFDIPFDLIRLFAKWFSLIEVKQINDEETIAKEIFSILNYIHKFGKPPAIKSIRSNNIINIKELRITRDHITDELLARSKSKYDKQCPLWFCGPSKETTIVYFIATSELNKGFSFLQIIIDCYNRTRIITKCRGNSYAISTREWYANCKFIRDLYKKDSKTAEDLECAVRIFCTKNAPPIQFNPLYKINDSVFIITKYIVAITQFIKTLVNDQPNQYTPFQFDVAIGIDVIDPGEYGYYDDDDTDDQDSDYSDDDYDERQRTKTRLATDYINNIHSKLKHEKLRFIKKTITKDLYKENKKEKEYFIQNDKFEKSDDCKSLISDTYIPDSQFIHFYNDTHPQWRIKDEDIEYDQYTDITATRKENKLSRVFIDCFNEFKEKVNPKKEEGETGGNEEKKEEEKEKEKEEGEYPQNMRFCLFIDRRDKNGKLDKGQMGDDEITFFEPPKVCRNIPSNHVSEWYFETIRRCIIPRRGFGDGEDENNWPHRPPPTDATITGQTSICGKLLTLSFHIESRNDIKCYIYWSGQTQRFLAKDIQYLLPNLFVKKIKTEIPEKTKPKPPKPKPAIPEPSTSEPSTPKPSIPEPPKPKPEISKPSTPEPSIPEPLNPEPTDPDSTKPELAIPKPPTPKPVKPAKYNCSECGVGINDKILRCVCQKAFYCNRMCQTNHWKAHKKQCKKFRSTAEKQLTIPHDNESESKNKMENKDDNKENDKVNNDKNNENESKNEMQKEENKDAHIPMNESQRSEQNKKEDQHDNNEDIKGNDQNNDRKYNEKDIKNEKKEPDIGLNEPQRLKANEMENKDDNKENDKANNEENSENEKDAHIAMNEPQRLEDHNNKDIKRKNQENDKKYNEKDIKNEKKEPEIALSEPQIDKVNNEANNDEDNKKEDETKEAEPEPKNDEKHKNAVNKEAMDGAQNVATEEDSFWTSTPFLVGMAAIGFVAITTAYLMRSRPPSLPRC